MAILKETTIPRRARTLCPKLDTGEGKTEQAHKETCDINKIIRDYTRTGFMRHASENQGTYDDFTSVDFEQSMYIVARVKGMFEELPAEVRKEFDNDPSKFLDYVQDQNNLKELQDRGVLKGNDKLDAKASPVDTPTVDDAKAAEEAAAAAAKA